MTTPMLNYCIQDRTEQVPQNVLELPLLLTGVLAGTQTPRRMLKPVSSHCFRAQIPPPLCLFVLPDQEQNEELKIGLLMIREARQREKMDATFLYLETFCWTMTSH